MNSRRRRVITAPTPERSAQMSLVRGKGNRSTEERFASLLRNARIKGWRRHANLPGRPDFSFPRDRIVVFVDGCFWHACPKCRRRLPKSNASFWRNKIESNTRRDRKNSRTLRSRGWRVFRVWEHSLSQNQPNSSRVVRALRRAILSR
jgi:DNA mismatch endonuclease (patch repair protein)